MASSSTAATLLLLLPLACWGFLHLASRAAAVVNRAEAPKTCSPTQFVCKDGLTCISLGWRCDGEKDCPDGSDESPEICQKPNEMKCQVNHYHCLGTELCIHMSKLCDGNNDCPDGYDEGTHCRGRLAGMGEQ